MSKLTHWNIRFNTSGSGSNLTHQIPILTFHPLMAKWLFLHPCPGPIDVTTDSAPGFASLLKSRDKQLSDLQITITTRDEFNNNYNAVVDKACQELEGELRKLAPEGGKITQSQLTAAVFSLNAKLRRKDNLSAYEIHTARAQHIEDNIQLRDTDLRKKQLQARASTQT